MDERPEAVESRSTSTWRELDAMGFDTQFAQCEVDCGDAEVWKDTKFRYPVRVTQKIFSF